MTNVGGLLFFSAKASATGRELWKSNGTAIGTQVVKDIDAGTAGSYPAYLTNVNGTLFFNASDSNGEQLWKSDGTEVGTVLVKPFNAATGANDPKELANAMARCTLAQATRLWGASSGKAMALRLVPCWFPT